MLSAGWDISYDSHGTQYGQKQSKILGDDALRRCCFEREADYVEFKVRGITFGGRQEVLSTTIIGNLMIVSIFMTSYATVVVVWSETPAMSQVRT